MADLSMFRYGTALQGTLVLFESLGIHLNTPSNLPIPLEEVLPDVPQSVRNILDKIETAYFVGTIDDKTLRGEDEALSLEDEIESIDSHYKGMMVFAVEIASCDSISRSEIAALNRVFNRMSKSAPVALVVKYSNKLSFSICERTAYQQSYRTGEKPGRVSILRDIDLSHTHRGHLDILDSINASGITTFDGLYAKWLDVFSSETLTKKFYQELSNWYALAIQIIRFPNDITTDSDDTLYNHEGAIRLITRLIFVWFLRQRNLIPSELFDPTFIGERLLNDFYPQEPVGLFQERLRSSHYYRAILQNLFFATLNCPLTKEGRSELTERRFKNNRGQFDVNNLMRYRDLFRDPDLFIELCNKVPFLNGGLFDCLDEKSKGIYYDGFSERTESIRQLCVPDYLFFSDNIRADLSEFYDDKKRKNETVRGLIKIFNRYQFTVEENTPLDQEVALDPELLGKVFENLLASFNPETKLTARKQTGSFYTPRHIVQYMVDESLIAHLKRIVGVELESEYRKLLSYADEPINLSSEQRRNIMMALYNCKIIDISCGSGAFPMGALQQMVHILTKIDPDNSQWKEMLLNIAIDETTEAYRNSSEEERQEAILDIERSFNEQVNRPDYARKLYLIENCIYGVDIQPIAIQISKLRFFISLVIDQKCNDNPAENYSIRPLPNLEAKFVAANSLRSLSANISLGDSVERVRELKESLKRINHRIFSIKSHKWKKELERRLAETRLQLIEELDSIGMFTQSESSMLANWDMFDQNHHADFFDAEWMFGITGGFDIVIGNPPYVVVSATNQTYKDYVTRKCFDLYAYFFERGIKLLTHEGILTYITASLYVKVPKFVSLRDYLTIHTQLSKFRIEGDSVFDSVGMPTATIIITKGKKRQWSFTDLYDDGKITSKLEKHPQLSKLSSIRRGYEIGRNAVSTNGDVPIITGTNVTKWIPKSKSFISTHTAKEFAKESYYFEGERVYIRETGSEVTSLYLSEPLLCTRSLYSIKCKDVDAKYICGILNSKLVQYYYTTKFKSETELFPKIRIAQVREIPIPLSSLEIQQNISSLVTLITDAKRIDADANVSVHTAHLDRLVYHLYNLTYDEVLIVDPEPPFSRDEYEGGAME